MLLNNMNRHNPNMNSMATNHTIINTNNNMTNIIDYNSIKNMDFILLDSYENIKNIEYIKDMTLTYTIFLIFEFNGKIRNNKYKIKDLYSK